MEGECSPWRYERPEVRSAVDFVCSGGMLQMYTTSDEGALELHRFWFRVSEDALALEGAAEAVVEAKRVLH